MGRIGRSFQLLGESYRVLMQDKELMLLPLMSAAIIAAAVIGLGLGVGLSTARVEAQDPTLYLPIFGMYVVSYTIGIFFQAAVIAGATERMKGGNPTLGSALSAAWSRIGSILLWAIVAATVGTILRIIHDRVGFLGRIIVALVGAAWSLATFFVVPVLVLEERSVKDSFTQSVSVFKQMWGETFVSGISVGLAAFCAWVTLVAITGLLVYVIGISALLVFAVGAIVLFAFFSTLDGIFVASLYRYATHQSTQSGISPQLLSEAFIPKTR